MRWRTLAVRLEISHPMGCSLVACRNSRPPSFPARKLESHYRKRTSTIQNKPPSPRKTAEHANKLHNESKHAVKLTTNIRERLELKKKSKWESKTEQKGGREDPLNIFLTELVNYKSALEEMTTYPSKRKATADLSVPTLDGPSSYQSVDTTYI